MPISFPPIYFAEREENVKADIFTAYRALLKCTNPKMQAQPVDGDTMETGDRYVVGGRYHRDRGQ